jgi:hypothetical protein
MEPGILSYPQTFRSTSRIRDKRKYKTISFGNSVDGMAGLKAGILQPFTA